MANREHEELDLYHHFGHVIPWLWQTTPVAEDVDKPETRAEVERILQERFGEPLMWQVATALNRLIERGNAAGRFRFRLLPEPAYLPERRWFTMSPATESLAQQIDAARAPILRAITRTVEDCTIQPRERIPLLLLTLVLDDGHTAESTLHELLGASIPLSIRGRPFLQIAGHTVRDECIPVGYCSARVLAACSSADLQGEEKPDLRALYARAHTWVTRAELGPGVPHPPLPKSLRDLLAGTRLQKATKGIPALGYMRNRRRASAALSASGLVRLITGRPVHSGKSAARGEGHAESANKPTQPHLRRDLPGRATAQLDARIREILYRWFDREHEFRERGEVAAELDAELAGAEPSIEYLLGAWAAAMARAHKVLKPPAPRTVYSLYSAVSSLLGPYLDQAYLTIDDGDSWQALYAEIAAEVGDTRGAAVWRHLQSFHQYITQHHGAGQVNFGSLELEEALPNVDNDLITVPEYRYALAQLHTDGPEPRSMTCARILLVLAFRFGLRFTEARRIQINQIEDAADPWLHVHKNRWQKRLKSEPRRMPMDPLVPPRERNMLLEWRRARLNEVDGDETAAVVGEGPGRPDPISEYRVREWLQEALYRATGDPHTRFHHLRHSFATWTLFRLLRPCVDDRILQGVAAIDDPELAHDAAREWRGKLLLQSSGQEAMWVVAQMLGHVSVDITRRSYLHLLPWLALCESWSGRSLQPGDLQQMLGVGRSTAYEIHNRWGRSLSRATRDWPTGRATRLRSRRRDASIDVKALAGCGAYAEMAALCRAASALPAQTQQQPASIDRGGESESVSAEDLRQFIAAGHEVAAKYITRAGQSRFSVVVRLPRARAERADIDAWLGNLAHDLEVGNAGARMRAGRILAWSAATLSYGRSSVRLPSQAHAVRFLECLQRSLGVPTSRILVLTAPVKGESEQQWTRRKRALARGLGLRTRQIERRGGAPAAPGRPPSIEVSVQAPAGSAQGPQQSRRGSEAYRAIVHYGLVWLAMRNHSTEVSPHSL